MTERHLGGEPDRLPARGVPEAPEAMPDPGGATTPQEFVGRLRAVKAWCGDPSLRELERRTGLPRSTLSGDLSPRRSRLPPLERVLALTTALGVPAEELARWQSAWQRIQVRQRSTEPAEPAPAAPPPAPPAVEPPAPEAAPRPSREPERTGRHRLARRRLVRPVLSAGGVLAGVLLALPLTATPVPGDQPLVPAGARIPDGCGYLGRISDHLAAAPPDAAATTGESLPVRSPVAKGDTLIVTLVLAGAGAGPITVRDTAGNRYRAIRDETADDTRVTVFALFDARPLDALDQITFLWPSSKHDYTAVDDFRSDRAAAPASGPGTPGDRPTGARGGAKQC
ncbi:hypothetical protein ABTX81_26295 [Kitasatospora sp. NPDC097605]|uniref:helix-turn-helix domain-containing protein n=1 Tax=Kitasatospora sp. NPDC097605 TaxID=3157226 RepID=UPI00332063EB